MWRHIVFLLMGPCSLITGQLYDYHFINENKTWTEAQSFCRENYTDLATVYRRSDIKNLNQTGAWIGLNYCLSINGTWSWTQPGVEFNDNETEWSEGEPNDQNQPENCAAIDNKLNVLDLDCSQTKLFVCYKEHENKTYVVEENKTWLEALKHCRDNMGDLATQEQARWNGSELQTGDHRWIGLFRDRWMWSDGSSFSFRHWEVDETGTERKCAFSKSLGKWDPDGCEKEKICAFSNSSGEWDSDGCEKARPFFCYSDNFILVNENKTWTEALHHCRQHHSDLISITDVHQQKWIQHKAKNASSAFVWLGMHYTCTLQFWFWVTDEAVRYDNWRSDNVTDNCDMSAAMESQGAHKWVRKNYEEKFNFFCFK
ncbi:macrophage mannose receptor 1-like [Echeneis naucrates]|uniref:macrophage mannose receptor 1-like n=1 Tax=Echeneis naucrates TaxID=173247 RepID=UPI001113C8D8|nr:macrophage mannose receptor 1-like [Echeneis naucrates]